MVRIISSKGAGGDNKIYIEAAGLSTDTKPTAKVVTGSYFFEVDTGFWYSFDETDNEWIRTVINNAQLQEAVDAWLVDHPEASTTVQDGAITLAKMNSSAVSTLAETKSYLNIT